MLGCEVIQRDGRIAHAFGQRPAHQRSGSLEADVFVVIAHGSLGGRREDGRGEFLCLTQAGRQRDAADLTRGLIVLPAGADEVTAHDRLDRQCLQTSRDHTAAHERCAFGRIGHH